MNITGYKNHLASMKDLLADENENKHPCEKKIEGLERSINNCNKKIRELQAKKKKK